MGSTIVAEETDEMKLRRQLMHQTNAQIDFGKSPLFQKVLNGEPIGEDFSTEIPKGLDEKVLFKKHDRMLDNLSQLMLEVGFGYKLTQQMNRNDAGKTLSRLSVLSQRAQKVLKAR